MAGLDFNANEVEPNKGFEVVPAGEYDGVVVSSEVNPTKNGKFLSLKLEISILSGPCQNRKIFDRLNFKKNPAYNGPWTDKDEQAYKIGAGNLSSLCRAVNVRTPKDTIELHMKPFRFKTTVRTSDEYGPQNDVKAYKPREAGPVAGSPF